MPGEDKPQREYVRVPTECRMQLETMAARHDVPLRSLTRLALSLGMAMLAVDERSVKEAVMRLRRTESPPAPRSPQVSGAAAR